MVVRRFTDTLRLEKMTAIIVKACRGLTSLTVSEAHTKNAHALRPEEHGEEKLEVDAPVKIYKQTNIFTNWHNMDLYILGGVLFIFSCIPDLTV